MNSATACPTSSGSQIGSGKDRETRIWALVATSSSTGSAGVPLSSSTVRICTTENLWRMATGSASRRSAIVLMPSASSRLVSLPATPQTSVTGNCPMRRSQYPGGA